MNFGVRTEMRMAAGSTWGKRGREAENVQLPWEGSSAEQPHVASVLRLRGAAGSPPLFWGSCAFTQNA